MAALAFGKCTTNSELDTTKVMESRKVMHEAAASKVESIAESIVC